MEPSEQPLTRADGRRTTVARVRSWLAAGPAYPPDAGDLRTVDLLGLRLPVRATVAVLAVSLLLLLDYHGRINGLVDALLGPFGEAPAETKRLQAIGRFVVQGAIPL